MNTLIITAYNRAASLLLCLQSLSACDLSDVRVVVSEDCRNRPPQVVAQMQEAVRRARILLDFEHVQRQGCRAFHDNIWGALHEASGDFIYVVEDDSIVESDFIRWHQQSQAQFQPFISCADTRWAGRANEVVLSHSDSTVRACCISQETLRTVLSQPQEKHFEEVLQCCLIQHKKTAVLPLVPRAHNIDVVGTNLGAFKPVGTLDEQVAQLRGLFTLSHSYTSGELVIGVDRRDRWQKAFDAQKKWGF